MTTGAEHSLLDNTTFWFAVAFVLFLVFAGRTALKAVTSWLDGRITKIASDLKLAAALRAEAEALLADAQKRHAEAGQQADAMIEAANAEAAQLRTRLEAETKALLARREAQVEDRIKQAEAQALADIQRQTVAAAMDAARALLARQLDDKARAALADATISDIKAA